MKTLTDEQLMLKGGLESRCGSSGETFVVEAACTVAGGLIGWALSGGNPLGAVYGAKIGFSACSMACHS